jgi:hypothetical protein
VQTDGGRVFLVSCVSQKRQEPCTARDLYISNIFCKARQYAEDSGCPWFILSAQYGLVAPSEVIAPYERTLNTMGIADRRAWSDRVAQQLDAAVPNMKRVVFLAGERYRQFLTQYLTKRGIEVFVPMEGLRIGQQLSWLSKNTPESLK